MKDKKPLIIVAAVVVILLLLGGFFMMQKSDKGSSTVNESGFVEEDLPKLSANEVGLILKASSNKKQVQFMLSKAAEFTGLEYELSYEADSAGGGEDGEPARITRGVAGEDTLDGSAEYTSKMLDLGSCSSGTCRYDTGVKTVKLLLKLTKTDGTVYQVDSSITL